MMRFVLPTALALVYLSCQPTTTADMPASFTTFADDVSFLEKYADVLVLKEPFGQGQIAVSAALQARVMTSSTQGKEGRSHGWINRALFESRDTLAHINPFGGEERFWLGPEGGQYSIFFAAGAAFDLDRWQTPRLIDLDPFELTGHTSRSATYEKRASITNYSGFTFDLGIQRRIEVLPRAALTALLGIVSSDEVAAVGYRSTNTLTNLGTQDWDPSTGLLSIWILGMFPPSAATTVVIPYHEGSDPDLGPIVNDTYFGKVPADRLKAEGGFVFFQGDGQLRSKIGLTPQRAKDVLGSYDPISGTLTIIKYNKPAGTMDYVNSLWEIQEQPYRGDVVNSYNDGPPTPGEQPLGPFYELETSSPALALQAGTQGTHTQITCHFEGPREQLDQIAVAVLGIGLDGIEGAFSE